MAQMSDLVLIVLTDGNAGTHGIIGPSTKTNYGYHASGEQFYVRQADADSLIAAKQASLVEVKQAVPSEAKQVVPSEPGLLDVWGMNEERIAALAKMGVTTPEDLAAMTTDALNETIGVSAQSASRIISAAKKAAG